MQPISVLQAVFGLAMLTFGRHLYWLFIAAVGFALGFNLASRLLSESTIWILLAAGLVGGVLAALAALFMNRLVIGLVGFLVGGFLIVRVVELAGFGLELPTWLLFMCGGAACTLLVAVLFDWALVLLTSMAGAAMLVQLFDASPTLSLALFALLAVIGLVFQARLAARK